ncbi:MAG: head GIN domain-containing protein [Bacteroidota bacterium]
MKPPRLLLCTLCCLLSFSMWAQLQKTLPLTTFSKIHYEGQGSIYLERSDHTASVRVEAQHEDHLKNVIVEIIDQTLFIRYNLHSPGHPVFARPRLDIYLTYRQLDAITVSGKVRIDSNEPIQTHQLDLHAEGFVDLNLEVQLEHFHAFIEGNVAMTLSGKTHSQDIHLEGQGSINAFNLISQNTVAMVNGTGALYLNVNSHLEAVAGGLSKIVYKGNPVKRAFNKMGKVSITEKET